MKIRGLKSLRRLRLLVWAIVLMGTVVCQGQYSGGSGTAEDPYKIATEADLNTIDKNRSKFFLLTADIDMSAYTGTQNSIIDYFSGSFDGNGHVIRNLHIKSSGQERSVGLFGVSENATIKNIGIENVSFSTDSDETGGLVGCQDGGSITNCYSTGTVISIKSPSNYYIYCSGGLVGCQKSGSIINCFSTGTVSTSSGFYSNNYYYAGGLVGCQYGGSITNCYSTGTVSPSSNTIYTGGLVGCQYGGSVTNCYSTGTVSPSGIYSHSGGLVGYQDKGSITNCYSTGTVSPSADNTYAGGLVGFQNSGSIMNCYSTGTVFSYGRYSYAGGLVGFQNNGSIRNCYSEGIVSSSGYTSGFSSRAGGLVGYQDKGSITNCYSTGLVTSSDFEVIILGGLVGSGNIIINCFWDTQTSRLMSSAGGVGLTTVQMKQSTSYIGWNMPSQISWTIDEDNDYPRLVWENRPGVLLSAKTLKDYVPGVGTETDPYRISTPQHLNIIGLFTDEWSKVFRLEDDIDMSAYTGMTFNRIGGLMGSDTFTGVFDGNNHIIRNLAYTTISLIDYVGLFGKTRNATIKNLGLENVTFSTKGHYAGGLIGYQDNGSITNCFSTGMVSSSVYKNSYAGGLVGYLADGRITNCYSIGIVSSFSASPYSYAGGLVGYQYYGAITNCYSMGTASASASTSYVGGLVGYQYYGAITSCYSMGNAFSSAYSSYAGGLVGYQYYGAITRCYSTVIVSSTSFSYIDSAYAGGLVGCQDDGSIMNCYSTGTVSSTASYHSAYAGGLVAYQYRGSITNCYNTGEVISSNSMTMVLGGLVGVGNTFTNCFWDLQTSGQSASAGGTGKTTAQMQTPTTFIAAKWDYINETANGTQNIWYQLPNDYPRLVGVGPVDIVTKWVQVAKRRVSRSVYEYDFALEMKNKLPFGIKDITLGYLENNPRIEMVKATLAGGTLAAGQTKQTSDFITVRVDRTQKVDPGTLQLLMTYGYNAAAGDPVVTGSQLAPLTLEPNETITLNRLAEHWLGEDANSDLTGDGRVDLNDFDKLSREN